MSSRPRPLGGLPGWLVGLALAAAAAWVALLGSYHLAGERTPLDRLEDPLADMRLLLAGPRPAPSGVVVVAIDDATIAMAGSYPLDRLTLARLVRAIAAAGPRALAVDLLLVDATTERADGALAEALAAIPSVLAAAGRFAPRAAGAGGVPRTTDELWPRSPMAEAASVGLVNVSSDPGGTPRHLPLLFQTSRGLVPSFALRAAQLATGEEPVFAAGGLRLGEVALPLDFGAHMPLRFRGPRGAVETLSAADLLAGRAPAEAIRGRVAVLGVSATAVGDDFSTPFDPVTPGVEVLATGMGQLLDGAGLRRDAWTRRVDVAAALLLACGGVFLVARAPLSVGLGLAALALGFWLAATALLFGRGYWLSGVLPLAGMVPPVAAVTILRQIHDRRRTQAIARSEGDLRRFHAPALASRLERDPGFLREPVEQVAAILFVDLSGFTGMSEAAGAAWTRDFLEEFYVLVEAVASEHHGLVLNFMGDGAMIVFGVPDPHPDDGARAVEACFALVEGLRVWIAEVGGPAEGVDLRVGGHFGPIVVSRLGGESHQQITATGDSVNLASRMMEVAKANGATVAISADLLARGAGRVWRYGEAHELRPVQVRGRREPVSVALWRLRCSSSPRPA